MKDPEVLRWLEGFFSSGAEAAGVSRRRWLRGLVAPLLLGAAAGSGLGSQGGEQDAQDGPRCTGNVCDPNTCAGSHTCTGGDHCSHGNTCTGSHTCTGGNECRPSNSCAGSNTCDGGNMAHCSEQNVCSTHNRCMGGRDWQLSGDCQATNWCDTHEGVHDDCFNDACISNDWCADANLCQIRNEDCGCWDSSCQALDHCAQQ